MADGFDLEKALMSERPRLVRLCARLSGSRDAAEDLAQETLLVAWRAADRLTEPENYAPWLSAIARNVCRSWSRRHYREQARLIGAYGPVESASANVLDSLQDDFDLEVELERDELALLLDRALALLPRDTGAMLVQHYVEESPHAEIAARLGISEGAVGVRLHRGKLALRRVLAAELGQEAAEYGLGDGWEETRIWCPECGGRRLDGKWDRAAPGGMFLLRCPTCDDANSIMTSADLSVPAYAEIFSGIKSYKPALSRLKATVSAYLRRALADHRAACLVCGREARLWWGQLPEGTDKRHSYQLRAVCEGCGWGTNSSLQGMITALPEGLQFWREHPRMRSSHPLEVEAHGVPALLTRLQSTTDEASLTVVSARDTFRVLAIHKSSNN